MCCCPHPDADPDKGPDQAPDPPPDFLWNDTLNSLPVRQIYHAANFAEIIYGFRLPADGQMPWGMAFTQKRGRVPVEGGVRG